MKNNLNNYLQQTKEKQEAIGHFNFATADVLRAIVEGSKEAGAKAVMVGTSEGEASFLGLKEAVALVRAIREDYNFPVFLNADHFKSFEKCKTAIDEGYDSIIIDASTLEFEENIKLTQKVLEYAKNKNPDVSIEGELGYLRGSSQVQQKIEITPEDFTKPEEAKVFVEKTGVDRLAIVFGNIHGIVTDQEEKLDINRLQQISLTIPDVFLVLHGASGLKDQDIINSINNGISNIHFNTELRVAYKESLEEALHQKPEETTPYKYLASAIRAVKELVKQKTRFFIKTQ
ncbi:MAG: ketose-bisphosphate aldolase [Parcubacteria group bacterium]|nr:ketose-bisphosphate aldolase [Parcubacteria group bacterium]